MLHHDPFCGFGSVEHSCDNFLKIARSSLEESLLLRLEGDILICVTTCVYLFSRFILPSSLGLY